MSDIGKTALKNKIDAKIYDNESQLITGTILNDVLQDAVDTLADGGNLDAGSVDTANLKDEAVTKGKLEQNVSTDLDWAVASNSYYRNSQAGNVAAKVITTYKNMSLIGGGSLKVTFEQANTADDATLNIDGKGAKPLYYNGQRVSSTNSWEAGETVEIYYNNYTTGIYYAKRWMVEPVSVSQNTLSIGGEDKGELAGQLAENPEWIYVWTDADGRILFGLKIDGSVEWAVGVPQNVKDYVQSKIDELSLDEYPDIVTFLGNLIEGDKNLQVLLNERGEYIDNDEFIDIKTDSQGRILEATRKSDGTKVFGGNIELGGNIKDLKGKSLSANNYTNEDKELVSINELVDDPEERTEIKTDSEGHIISYRDKDGVLHENVGTETESVTTNHLELTSEGMTEFQQALKDSGFQPGGAGDFSDAKAPELPTPKHYGMLNLLIPSLPVEDSDSVKGYVEYYDYSGNYFKKKCKVEPQGQTSKIFVRTGGKGNYTLKIDDKSKIKFGEWVPQKSFHLKGCAKDVTRGILATSYKWAYEFMLALDAKPNRVLMHEENITNTNATGDRLTDWPTDARCMPDGFPVEMYLNGEYWGLYALQLQKKSENYSMKDTDYTTFYLDTESIMSDSLDDGFWTGDIWWDKIDIKNPEPLIDKYGEEFDGDAPVELIDPSCPAYDPNNQDHVNTYLTKTIIESFPTKYQEVKTLIEQNNIVQAKEKFTEYFDYNSCMLVYIFNCLMRNGDSIKKNTLWAIYKNGKIAPMLWDLDAMYGEGWVGNKAQGPWAVMWDGTYATAAWPLALFWSLYETEIKAAYADLRRSGVINIKKWHEIVFGWVESIGPEAYERDIKKWKETPSYRANYTNTEYWTEGDLGGIGDAQVWNENTQYSQGDVVALYAGYTGYYMKYTAVQASLGICPVTKFYESFPTVGGYYNSPKRMEKWMKKQIELCDSKLGYSENV